MKSFSHERTAIGRRQLRDLPHFRLIGAGGMGTMYLAHDDDLDRPVALKLLSRTLADDADLKARFLQEAKTAARLSHPNIVSIYARGVHEGQLYIAMQYVDGSDAAWPIRAGQAMSVERAVRIIGETAAALDYAHARGILHRDVKPANILLAQSESGQSERVVLADFGIAKALEDTAKHTHTGLVLASFQYAAPEQFDPNITLDHRVDVYALGATFHHLLTGQQPFPGTGIAQLISGHLNQTPPRPSTHGVPIEVDHIVATALAKDREQRYPTCGQLAADARTAAAELSRRDLPLSPPPTTASPSAHAGPRSYVTPPPTLFAESAQTMMRSHYLAGTEQPPPRKDHTLALAALAGVVVLAVTAILVAVVLSGRGTDTPGAAESTLPPAGTDGAITVSTGARPPDRDFALNVSAPITQPLCDGTGIVVLGSAVTPGRYETEIQQFLDEFPGADYLRTDHACPSLRQETEEGNPIYAVYRPAGRTQTAICAAVRAAGGSAYGKWLDNTTDPSYIIPC
ncbi:serine/threonine-protein kinase [Antrihabitans sp. YC2-6]|uniref:serine/threonine-protein kinase n=1 Tax=Antrihabitans sp. YC2-6 TaxID=2799498 RepID=UPI0018F6F1C4|nr:serine/threonine-protein kinase [Antrihabitans sp. YC2-6]MBJ8348239.1 serine/threonine protein kinase [Antrihabitans sp. YC2-6]